MPPEAYYEQALQKAIRDITAGKYDDCSSGLQIVERIANHKTKVQQIQSNIESTLHNMEMAEELIASEPDNKRAQAWNRRSATLSRRWRTKSKRSEGSIDAPASLRSSVAARLMPTGGLLFMIALLSVVGALSRRRTTLCLLLANFLGIDLTVLCHELSPLT